MAIVPDLAREAVIDPPLATPNRRVAGTPIALALVPMYSGEIVQDTATGSWWYAQGVAANAWTPYVLNR